MEQNKNSISNSDLEKLSENLARYYNIDEVSKIKNAYIR